MNANDFSSERDASYNQLRCSGLRRQYRKMCRARPTTRFAAHSMMN